MKRDDQQPKTARPQRIVRREISAGLRLCLEGGYSIPQQSLQSQYFVWDRDLTDLFVRIVKILLDYSDEIPIMANIEGGNKVAEEKTGNSELKGQRKTEIK